MFSKIESKMKMGTTLFDRLGKVKVSKNISLVLTAFLARSYLDVEMFVQSMNYYRMAKTKKIQKPISGFIS
jgi:hypothetical protein